MRYLNLNGEINEGNTIKFIADAQKIIDEDKKIIEENKTKLKTERTKLEDVTINITSPGGGIYFGSAILDIIDEIQANVHTHGRGFVMSMAFIIFLKGEDRSCGDNCHFMNHSSSSGVWGYVDDLKTEVSQIDRVDDAFDELIISKTKLTKEDLKEGRLKCMYFNKKEAKKLNIVNI